MKFIPMEGKKPKQLACHFAGSFSCIQEIAAATLESMLTEVSTLKEKTWINSVKLMAFKFISSTAVYFAVV